MSTEVKFAADIEQIRDDVRELYTALVGDKISQDGGLVRRINNVETRQDMADARVNKLSGKVMRVGWYVKVIWGIGGAIAMAVYSLIIKK